MTQLLPFALLSRQEIVKLYNYCQKLVQTNGESAVNISCWYSNDCELKC